jgi:hypothetical protein
MRRWTVIALSLALAGLSGCAWMDVPMAHRGMRFSRSGPLDLAGGEGFTGAVLRPGTYHLGIYDQMMLVDCSIVTSHDPLTVLTQDGVQFGLDIYVRYSANCDADESVVDILSTLSPAERRTITSQQLFETYIRPAIASVIREIISPHRANEINNLQQELLPEIRRRFMEEIDAHEGNIIRVYEVSLSNLDFPATLDLANEQRAVQTIMRDAAIAETERVQAQTGTALARRELLQREGEAVAARIDAIGEALARHPEYIQYDLQERMPSIYAQAGAQGNLIITAPQPTIMVSPEQH